MLRALISGCERIPIDMAREKSIHWETGMPLESGWIMVGVRHLAMPAGVAYVVSIVEAENLGELCGTGEFGRSWGEDPRDWMHKHLRGRVVARGFQDWDVLGALFVVEVELDVEWGTFDDMRYGSGLEDHVTSAEDWGEDVGVV